MPPKTAMPAKRSSLVHKLALLKAVSWLITALACWVYFTFMTGGHMGHGAASPSAGLMITLVLGAMVAAVGLSLSIKNQSSRPYLLFMFLFTDVCFLASVIYFTGGIVNPFTSSLLVPIALAVMLVPRLQAAALMMAAIAIYGYWLWDVDATHMAHHNFSLHLYGMGINFLLSAVLLTVFIGHALESVKKHEKALTAAREKMTKDEQLVGIAALTANTAHALGTPLQTLTIITDELTAGSTLDAHTLEIIRQQLRDSQGYLQQLVHTAQTARTQGKTIQVAQLMTKIAHHYSLQPHAKQLVLPPDQPYSNSTIPYNESLFFAVINLIDNALQAAKKRVELRVTVTQQEAKKKAQQRIHQETQPTFALSIIDDGPGIPEAITQEIGTPFMHKASIQPPGQRSKMRGKHAGLGLGYYLSNYTIEQNHGKLIMANNSANEKNDINARSSSCGSVTEIHLPITTKTSYS